MQRLGLGLDEVADRGVTLGHPGPLVEQRCRLGERCVVERHGDRALRLQRRDRTLVRGLGRRIAVEFAPGGRRHPEAQAREPSRRHGCVGRGAA